MRLCYASSGECKRPLIEGVRIVAVETLVEVAERLTATSPAGYQRKRTKRPDTLFN